MSPRSPRVGPSPAASAWTRRLTLGVGQAVQEERRRRGWTIRQLAERSRLSATTIVAIEAGRPASVDAYGRLAVLLGVSLEVVTGPGRQASRDRADVVHSAMGEWEADPLARVGHEVGIDVPYQHYQFAGRADVVAWRRDPPALLHIENRTRMADLQDIAGSFNAKCQYLAPVLAREIGLRGFASQTHVMVGLWSAEVIHAVRLRPATVRALAPDGGEQLMAWLRGEPPRTGLSRSFVVLDPFASGRQRAIETLEAVLSGVRPRMRGYHEAAERLAAAARRVR